MRRLIFVFICAVALIGCKPTDKDFIKIGENLVRDTLKDPDSAKFDSSFHAVGEMDGYVCGRVNAKNSYGAYTGKKPYYVYIDTEDGKLKDHGAVVIASDDDNSALEKFRLFCK
ncbi:hypothetical protein ACP6QU_001066 [Cronobacter dublinensis]